MKQMKSFAKVERFLKSCNKGAIKEYVGYVIYAFKRALLSVS
jgi:hypothetical protein